LTPSEVGDTDGDGFLEVLDGWGDPMEFSIFARVNPFAPNDPPTLNDFVFNIDSSRDF